MRWQIWLTFVNWVHCQQMFLEIGQSPKCSYIAKQGKTAIGKAENRWVVEKSDNQSFLCGKSTGDNRGNRYSDSLPPSRVYIYAFTRCKSTPWQLWSPRTLLSFTTWFVFVYLSTRVKGSHPITYQWNMESKRSMLKYWKGNDGGLDESEFKRESSCAFQTCLSFRIYYCYQWTCSVF